MKRRSFFGAIAGLFGAAMLPKEEKKLLYHSNANPQWAKLTDGFEYLKEQGGFSSSLQVNSVSITTNDGKILQFQVPSILHFNVHEGEVRGIISVSNVKPTPSLPVYTEKDAEYTQLSGRSGGQLIVSGTGTKGQVKVVSGAKFSVIPSRQCGKTAFMKDQNV